MRDTERFRAQAELCLKIAWQSNDPTAAKDLRAEAKRHETEADQIEAREHTGSKDNPERGIARLPKRAGMQTKGLQSSYEKRAYHRLLRHLLSEDLRASYKLDQIQPLPAPIADLLARLDSRTYETR
jgi:hypothetical protein